MDWGIASLPKNHSGSGLKNLQERAKEMNGEFSINGLSISGSGTEVKLRVPLVAINPKLES